MVNYQKLVLPVATLISKSQFVLYDINILDFINYRYIEI